MVEANSTWNYGCSLANTLAGGENWFKLKQVWMS